MVAEGSMPSPPVPALHPEVVAGVVNGAVPSLGRIVRDVLQTGQPKPDPVQVVPTHRPDTWVAGAGVGRAGDPGIRVILFRPRGGLAIHELIAERPLGHELP